MHQAMAEVAREDSGRVVARDGGGGAGGYGDGGGGIAEGKRQRVLQQMMVAVEWEGYGRVCCFSRWRRLRRRIKAECAEAEYGEGG